MAVKKRPGKVAPKTTTSAKPAPKVAPKTTPVSKTVEAPVAKESVLSVMPTKTISVSIAKTLNLGNYESVKVQAGYSEVIDAKADVKKAYDKAYALTEEIIDAKLEEYEVAEDESGDDGDESGDDAGDEEWGDDEGDEAGDDESGDEAGDDEITEEEVMAMTAKELAVVIKDYGLEVSPKQPLKALRAAVVESLFVEEGDEGDEAGDDGAEEWDDEEWDDDGEGAGDEE